jgi:hypothetical protein
MAHPGLIPLNNLRVTKVLCMYSTEVQTFFREDDDAEQQYGGREGRIQ